MLKALGSTLGMKSGEKIKNPNNTWNAYAAMAGRLLTKDLRVE